MLSDNSSEGCLEAFTRYRPGFAFLSGGGSQTLTMQHLMVPPCRQLMVTLFHVHGQRGKSADTTENKQGQVASQATCQQPVHT